MPCSPEQYAYPIQVAWQSSLPGGIAVAARTYEAANLYRKYLGTPRNQPRPSNKLLDVVDAASDTYTAADMCGFPANSSGYLAPGYTNFATWKLLTPGYKYYYFVGSTASGFSAIKSFQTPPLAEADCFTGHRGKYMSHRPNKPCFGEECDCLKHVKPLKMLLAADVGTNNNLDSTWSADGQGFPDLDAIQSRDTSIPGFPGPLWPGELKPDCSI